MLFKLFQLPPNRTQLVEDSFWKISSAYPNFAAMFYERFFSLYPHLKPMFGSAGHSAMEIKLTRTLTLAVENLRRPDTLVPVLESLGKRHRLQYRVLAPHYAMLTEALVKTIADCSGVEWNPALEAAWTEAIDGITEIMIYQA